MLYEALSRMRFLLRRRGSEELDEELQFHLEQSVQTNIAEGMTAEEARRSSTVRISPFRSQRRREHIA